MVTCDEIQAILHLFGSTSVACIVLPALHINSEAFGTGTEGVIIRDSEILILLSHGYEESYIDVFT